MRDDDHSVLAAFQELQVALGEALLVPLAKRLHDVISAVAVPLPGLGRMPLHIPVEDLLDRFEVALTPSLQALPSDLGRLAVHVTRIRPYFAGRRAILSAASCLQHCADQMELERARDLLRRERVRVERALARLNVPGREELAGQDEMADAASQLYEEEFDEGQADDLRAELAAVERAEARLLGGSYGRSIESGEFIPDERLEAVPTAERTAEEQARFEQG